MPDHILPPIKDALSNGGAHTGEQGSLFNNLNAFGITQDNLWKVDCLLGRGASSSLKQEITGDNIEALFKSSDYCFYVNGVKSILCSSDNELLGNRFGPLNNISIREALQYFGIDALEEVRERTIFKRHN